MAAICPKGNWHKFELFFIGSGMYIYSLRWNSAESRSGICSLYSMDSEVLADGSTYSSREPIGSISGYIFITPLTMCFLQGQNVVVSLAPVESSNDLDCRESACFYQLISNRLAYLDFTDTSGKSLNPTRMQYRSPQTSRSAKSLLNSVNATRLFGRSQTSRRDLSV
jgi:hypothetical protein